MHIARLFLLFSAGLIAATPARAQSPTPPPPEEKIAKPTPAPEPRISFDYIHVDGPYIAMTFDDGPSEKLTPKLLDLLAARHMKVTFFLIGENAAEFPQIVQREIREGHEIGNHSWSHPNLEKMSDDNVRRQLRRTDDAIKSAIGTSPTFMRPPYGSLSVRQKRWIHQEFGYNIILWDVDPNDWKRPGPAAVTSRIVRNTRAGSIILSHDIHPGTIEAMPATFDQLEAKGFKFVTVSELIKMATPEPPKAKPVAPKPRPEAKTSPSPGTSPKPSPPVQKASPREIPPPAPVSSPGG
jgi:peptidoglycan/xylan/chitin deacetylase (PgdA/CDA1 family)